MDFYSHRDQLAKRNSGIINDHLGLPSLEILGKPGSYNMATWLPFKLSLI